MTPGLRCIRWIDALLWEADEFVRLFGWDGESFVDGDDSPHEAPALSRTQEADR